MTPRKPRVVKPVVNPVDPRDAKDRVVDQAFQIQVRELTYLRKWEELRAVLLLYGSILTRREEENRDGTGE